MRCPNCNELVTCPCSACTKRYGVQPTDGIPVGGDSEKCAKCGFTANLGAWEDMEVDGYILNGSWPECEKGGRRDRFIIGKAIESALQHIEWKYFDGEQPLFSARESIPLRFQLKEATEAIERLNEEARQEMRKAYEKEKKCQTKIKNS